MQRRRLMGATEKPPSPAQAMTLPIPNSAIIVAVVSELCVASHTGRCRRWPQACAARARVDPAGLMWRKARKKARVMKGCRCPGVCPLSTSARRPRAGCRNCKAWHVCKQQANGCTLLSGRCSACEKVSAFRQDLTDSRNLAQQGARNDPDRRRIERRAATSGSPCIAGGCVEDLAPRPRDEMSDGPRQLHRQSRACKSGRWACACYTARSFI